MKPGLERLFRPKTIAVVGGGPWCANVIRKCREIGFAGPVWPVHPGREQIEGEAAFRDVAALPGPPDATFVGVNRHTTIDVVAALRDRGAGGAVCFAAGFSEARDEAADGPRLQAQLMAAAGEMSIIGPNCYGFVNYLDGALLWPDQHGGIRCDRGVAIVTQSSNIAINITMQRRGLPVAYVVTAGNQAQTGFAEIGEALLADPRATALGLHIEGIGDLRAFERLVAAARDLGKPIVALKIGRSDQSRAATVSHTASLAGSDAGSRALFERIGVGQVETIPEFIETLMLLHVVGPLRSNCIASLSCSGGEASLMADLTLDHGLVYPPLNDVQKTDLRAALGPMVKLANPLDYNTYIWPRIDAMTAAFTAMMDPSLALGLVVLDFPRGDRCETADWDNVIAAVDQTRAASGVPMGIVASLAENMPERVANRLVAMGIAPLSGMSEGLKAAAVAARLGQKWVPAASVLLPRTPRNAEVLTEAGAKAALALHGLWVPRSEQVASPEAAAEAAARIGFPVVLKGEGIAHKTEAGAVALNLADPASVRKAAGAMTAEGFLVEEMVTDTVAELLVGVVLDPAHGYVLTLGAGGIMTELMADTASLLIPADADAVASALRRLRIFPLLEGYRGKPGVDISAVVQAIMAVQAYVIAHHGQIEEVEINPLLCGPARAVAADALIRTGEADD